MLAHGGWETHCLRKCRRHYSETAISFEGGASSFSMLLCVFTVFQVGASHDVGFAVRHFRLDFIRTKSHRNLRETYVNIADIILGPVVSSL